jgi:hypothetical protein
MTHVISLPGKFPNRHAALAAPLFCIVSLERRTGEHNDPRHIIDEQASL